LSVDETPKIIQNEQGELAITMDIFDQRGTIAEIVKNEFRVNYNNDFKMVRRDRSELIVFGRGVDQAAKITSILRFCGGCFVFRADRLKIYRGISYSLSTLEPLLPLRNRLLRSNRCKESRSKNVQAVEILLYS